MGGKEGSKGVAERGEEIPRDTTEVNKRKGVSQQGRREKEKKRSWLKGTEGISNKPAEDSHQGAYSAVGGSFLHPARCLLTTELATRAAH